VQKEDVGTLTAAEVQSDREGVLYEVRRLYIWNKTCRVGKHTSGSLEAVA
jgi:hypothetical protein